MQSRRVFLRTLSRSAGSAAMGVPLIAADPVNVLRLSLPTGENHPTNITMIKFAEMVSQRSKGALRIDRYLNGSLANEQGSVTGLQTGTVDMTCQTTAFLQTIVPKVQILDLPFLFGSNRRAERTLDGPLGRELFADALQQGILGLAWGTNGWRELEFRDKKVVRPDDMHGLRMRIQNGPVYVSMMKALGAIPVVIDFTEVYVSLTQKTVDGLDIPLTTVLAAKFYNVTKNVSLTNHLYNAGPLLMSKQRFDGLPRDQQQVILSSARDLLPQWRTIFARWQASATKDLREKYGVTISEIDFAAFRKAMDPVYREFREKIGGDFFDRMMKDASG